MVLGFRPALLSLILMLVLVLSWAAVAQAQDPFAAQYGNPAAAGEAAIMSAGVSGGGGGTQAAAGVPTGILPSTGGSLLPFVALGLLALSSAGLLAIRRTSSNQ
jgi:LPXTG-motif cell wall-anchored protein